MSVILELSIFPMDKGESVSPHVARAVKIIRESGLAHEFGPMGTCIEGTWDDVSAVAGSCLAAMQESSERVYMSMKADWRKGRANGLTAKVQSVKDKIG
ncbi:MTH1187 family thiamine-binding protein [Pseudodesulfovibrio senegalensis]|uniref:MTH1187 family thiamine-binding protein n=1 Tax=Pseudodesulfovibrio senegalensis TaxID=1721087 RepID=A0A6N6N444_9BACT|nr:MTH1187 family thiamine-binding protein [Pseudodesulfovibrio senegalensis]KAB1442260.1 MTH1187 family thiamine-binding protein [Pseudodesulfovibrio senegalensis]